MSLKNRIDQDIKSAMREKRKDDLRTLRAIKSMILLAETEKGAGEGLSEDKEMALLTKAAKQRRESADIYTKEGRQDLADKELVELEVIERYLPEQLDEETLKAELQAIIEQVGAQGPKDMGKVMGVATKKFAGRADGKVVAATVKALLA
ncbi:aspartyl-tRNA amidotransferase subunit B [Fulvitalea axinellae]|uniref:Aspartyl-tRNA amidotransferase subunit B n=1 Tax=Fulvitalea axinellae TaxID=1182444 RepID=A0AAU9CF86_9BACT|nr:aspartyl-tRNA amidotransferase subunit B [Fulvitalea axinellae]